MKLWQQITAFIVSIIALFGGWYGAEQLVGAPGPTGDTLLTNNSVGYNGLTYEQDYNTLLLNAFDSKWNTTQLINSGTTYCNSTHPCRWAPWMSSSTECMGTSTSAGGNIKDGSYGIPSGAGSLTLNQLVTDEQGEPVMLVAAGNASFAGIIDQYYNTHVAMTVRDPFGLNQQLESWIWIRNNSVITCKDCGHSASDTTWRSVLSWLVASNNTAFTAANRTKYQNVGIKMMSDSLNAEFVYHCYNTTSYGVVCNWPFGGNGAASGGFGTVGSPAMYTGYYGDGLLALVMYSSATNNASMNNVSSDFIKSYLTAANYVGGTTGADFRVAPYRWYWKVTGTTVSADCVNYETGYCNGTNAAWEGADAPRVGNLCRAVVARNISGRGLTGAWSNLSDYCLAWANSGTFTNTSSCQSYNLNGSCRNGPYAGFKDNGMFIGFHTYQNNSAFVQKLDDIFSRYSWTGKTFDSSACGNGLSYNTVRAPKGLFYGLGYDQPLYGANGTAPNGQPASVTGNISITLNTPLNTSTGGNTTINLNVTVWANAAPNATVCTNGSSDTNFTTIYNQTFDSDAGGWSGFSYDSTNKYLVANSSWGWGYSPNMNLSSSNYSELCFMGWHGANATNGKLYFYENINSNANDRLITQLSGSNLRWQNEIGYNWTYSTTYNAWHAYCVKVNLTIPAVFLTVDGNKVINWTWPTPKINNGSGHNYYRFDFGDVAGTEIRIDNMTVSIFQNGSGSTCNTSYWPVNLSVKYYYVGGGLIANWSNVTNGTSLNYTLVLSPGNYSWEVRVTTINYSVNLTPLLFEITGTSNASIINGSLLVYSNLTGANVTINNTLVGSTPLNISLVPGTYLVNVSNYSYHQNSTIIYVPNNASNITNLSLRPMNGTLQITSNALDTNISVNNTYFGLSPINISLVAGSYSITATKTGYLPNVSITLVVRNQTSNLSFVLIPSNPINGTLLVYSIPNNTNVTVNGVLKGVTPQNLTFPSGFYNVGLSRNGYKEYSSTVNVTNGSITTLNITLNVTTPPVQSNATVSFCSGMNSIKLRSNVSRGVFNSTSRTYTEYNATVYNQSVCGFSYKINNSDNVSRTFDFVTNLTNKYFILRINVSNTNLSQNASFTLTNHTVSYVNVSADYIKVPINISYTFVINAVVR